MNQKPNTEAVVRLAAEKSEKARLRTREAIQCLQQQGKPINFSTVCEAARVSKTFLYDPRHADLAEEIRRLRELPGKLPPEVQFSKGKSESAKNAQIARLKDRVHKLEQRVGGAVDQGWPGQRARPQWRCIVSRPCSPRSFERKWRPATTMYLQHFMLIFQTESGFSPALQLFLISETGEDHAKNTTNIYSRF